MRTDNIFDRFLDAADRASITLNTTNSRNWFVANAKKIAGASVTPTSILESGSGKFRNRPGIGQMMLYFYDPKMKKTLPYYDRFPLTIILDVDNTGFMGLNLHYLPPKLRAILLGRLLETTSKKTLDEKTKFVITYQLLKKASKYRYFKPCVKRYLYSHIRSKFLKVDADEWEIAISLPVETFAKATKKKVWTDSVGKF